MDQLFRFHRKRRGASNQTQRAFWLILAVIFIAVLITLGLSFRPQPTSFKDRKLLELKQILWIHNLTNYQGQISESETELTFQGTAWMNGTDKVAAFNSTTLFQDILRGGFIGPVHTSASDDGSSLVVEFTVKVNKNAS